jgi:hypothetical protein
MSSSNVVRIHERAAAAPAEEYLGPAEAVRVDGHEVSVALPSGVEVRAELALAFPYAPAEGDTLLVIGRGPAYYVIGVLRGSGRSVFSLPGDVGLHAGGALHLSGAKGVKVEGPALEVHTGKMQVIADDVVQRSTTVHQRVTETLTVHAGESHTLVDDASTLQAKTAAIVTEETVTINGDEVHLG